MVDKVEDAVTTVTLRNIYHKDNSRKTLIALLLCVLVILVQVVTIVYLIARPPETRYFATSTDGRVTPLTPLDQPNLSQAALLQWANVAAISVYNYDYLNYNQVFQEASVYFTPDCFDSFMAALKMTGALQEVINKKVIVTAVAAGAPVIIDQQELNGAYTWKVQLPMLITYQGASTPRQRSVTVTMVIMRVSTLVSPRGIAIAQFIVSDGGDTNNG